MAQEPLLFRFNLLIALICIPIFYHFLINFNKMMYKISMLALFFPLLDIHCAKNGKNGKNGKDGKDYDDENIKVYQIRIHGDSSDTDNKFELNLDRSAKDDSIKCVDAKTKLAAGNAFVCGTEYMVYGLIKEEMNLKDYYNLCKDLYLYPISNEYLSNALQKTTTAGTTITAKSVTNALGTKLLKDSEPWQHKTVAKIGEKAEDSNLGNTDKKWMWTMWECEE